MERIRRERFGDFSVLHRQASGEGQVALHFAHATGFNAETYRELLVELDSSLDVYAMDARGHGMSQAPADPKKLRSWAPYRADLRAFVETMSRPTVLAGHSMGATVSMELAAARPDVVQGWTEWGEAREERLAVGRDPATENSNQITRNPP